MGIDVIADIFNSLPSNIRAPPISAKNTSPPDNAALLTNPTSIQTKATAHKKMATMEAAAQQLLAPNGEFDVSLLDQVITAAYSPADPNRAMANKALMALQESPDVWTKADAILERAQNPQSRFFGLQVLDDAIRTR